MKIKLILSYNGTSFEGSQVQKHTNNTIMGRLYEAFEAINIDTKLHASGRTDAGVHAFKQTMHCEIPSFWSDLSKLKELSVLLANGIDTLAGKERCAHRYSPLAVGMFVMS